MALGDNMADILFALTDVKFGGLPGEDKLLRHDYTPQPYRQTRRFFHAAKRRGQPPGKRWVRAGHIPMPRNGEGGETTCQRGRLKGLTGCLKSWVMLRHGLRKGKVSADRTG